MLFIMSFLALTIEVSKLLSLSMLYVSGFCVDIALVSLVELQLNAFNSLEQSKSHKNCFVILGILRQNE